MLHPPSGKGWVCQCGVPLGATRRQARDAQQWHHLDVNLARLYGGEPSLLAIHNGDEREQA